MSSFWARKKRKELEKESIKFRCPQGHEFLVYNIEVFMFDALIFRTSEGGLVARKKCPTCESTRLKDILLEKVKE